MEIYWNLQVFYDQLKFGLLENQPVIYFQLELQLQAIAARDIAHGFLGHSYQTHFSNLGTTNCHFKFVRCECVFNFLG